MKEPIVLFEDPAPQDALPPADSVRMGRRPSDLGAARGNGLYLAYLAVTLFVAVFTVFFLFFGALASHRAQGVSPVTTVGGHITLPAPDTTAAPETTVPATTAVPETTASPEAVVPPVPDLYDFDYGVVPVGAVPIVPMNLSLPSFGHTYIHNSTDYTVASALLRGEGVAFPTVRAGDTAPSVLIVHTHATEAYGGEAPYYYAEDAAFARSSDTAENVVAIGAYMAEIFNGMGIRTLHVTVLHDKESYRDSYRRSAETVASYLKRYPSIQYVLDIHRDWIESTDGDLARPVARVGEETVAQVMAVVGSDAGGVPYDTWRRNLAFAQRLRGLLNEKSPHFARPTCLRASSYNQELAPISILLEIGAGGNSMDEAMRAARHTAEAIGALLLP